jgi:hypothetical protein
MSEQRRIDLLFAATVRAMAVARLARKGAPVAATTLVVAVAVHGTLGGIDVSAVPRLAMDVPAGVATSAPVGPIAPVAGVPAEPAPAPVAAEAPSRPAPRLDREQENIARFIAQRYRVGLDATSEFVHHAYRAARDVKLDPMLVLAVMSVESSFNPRAQSHAGAQGLMQVLTRVHTEKFMPFGGLAAAFDPVANIRVGSAILKEYLTREGSVEGALKSYVGAALLEHDGGYGSKVLNARERIAAAAAGRPIPPEIVVAARPVAAAAAATASEPSMQPVVSAIVETRTPILEESRVASPATSVAAEPVSDAQRGAHALKGAGDI